MSVPPDRLCDVYFEFRGRPTIGIGLLVGPHTLLGEWAESVQLVLDKKLFQLDERYLGCTWSFMQPAADKRRRPKVISIVWLRRLSRRAEDIGVLVHELVHVLDYLANVAPERYADIARNGERRASFLGKVVEQCLTKYGEEMVANETDAKETA